VVLRLEDKKAIVAKIADIAARSPSVVAAEYRGMTVEEMTQLRETARKTNVSVFVARNTLVSRALENTEFSCMQEILVGPLVLAFSKEDPGAAARLMRDFAKDHEKLVIKALAVDGKLLSAKDIGVLANLPTRDQALSTMMAVMQAPIVKFARTLRETHAKLLRTLVALHIQKEGSV